MKIYRVTVSCFYDETLNVVADNEEEAMDVAAQRLRDDGHEPEFDADEITEEDRGKIDLLDIPVGSEEWDADRPPHLRRQNLTVGDILNDIARGKHGDHETRCFPDENQGTLLGIDPQPIEFEVPERGAD